MLKPQIQHSRSLPSIFRSHKPFFHGTVSIPVLSLAPAAAFPKTRKNGRVGSGCFVAGSIKAIATTEKSISVKAVVTVKPTVRDIFSSIEDSLGKTLMIELISSVTDEKTGLEKETIKGYAHQKSVEEGNVKYEGDFQVPEDFGEIGAVFVENEHHKEMYLEVIVLDGFMNGPINVTCNSWVHSKFDNPEKRVFFSHKEWPLKSALDLKIYGPQESAITSHILEPEIRGYTTVEEAIKQKKLFMLDYHDLLMPYVKNVREIKGHMLYGSRTIFFLTPDCILKPLAIELTRPPMDGKPQWKEVYTPGAHSTACWLWRLAKAHVLAHDSGYHRLVSHWLRTHACTEPYIIATNRQLSAMHPIYRLLHPHFRYTMEINALAREALINAGGIIESTFSPGKYSIEISSVAYDLQWRFDHQALPADLISRGMAVADPTAPHGLKLTVQDYPFANDGLVLWDCIKQWLTDYVTHYYADSNSVVSDQEIQSWWTEIRTVGHGDKKDEPWWSKLKTTNDLIEILTTIIWVTSGHHGAVNFGQYAYAGYFPNRPTVARRKMPTEDATDEEWALFLSKPEMTLLLTYPSQIQAMKVMAVLDALSMHSPDEEYLGEKIEPAWAEEPMVKAAFERFNGRLKELDGVVDERNADTSLKNRNGAGVMPYELLKPFSKSGVTTKGVPYSISI